ncbi:hypothetical protein MYCTH_2139072 [Thermothelomyces thermophilus ATCC 42464]|uniref:Uncharacterized protein n=1 Tax=Thermothelomyces thermophilus (strain ATCC 42464 / BCRC 31852 / DSM 1799) TaxID=573729 RepID=G2QEN4_THET4|nr:uncharacterized protein MYCTH_2139072 [Thermothelomyces thermophilus ATCC 42464]AEO57817.1 hypothetical protein MYCTH_2139072 [Thermothelomyces thermophilus ATCC 42464]
MAQRRRRSGGPGTGIVGEPQAPLALFHDWASSDDRRAFHFFQHITAPCLSGSLDGPFWRVLVPQICQSEPAVRHAVFAVSRLHEGMVQATMTPYRNTEDRNSFALNQYNRAIACLLDQMRTINARPLVPLLTCVLFVCIELMQSKDRESLLHLEQGRQILSQLGRKGPSDSPEIDLIKQHLVPMYTRLSLTSLMFGGEPVEVPAPLKTLTEVPMMFETVDEVRYALYDFMDECLRLAKRTRVAKLHDVPPEQMRAFEQEQDPLLRKLANSIPVGSISLIQIHVHTTFIWISTALSQHETVFDDYVDTFSAIIPLATEVISSLSTPIPEPPAAETNRLATLFTFEMYIIAPLYFVAAKCRHPLIRRAALGLLRRHPMRRENLWRANVMAAIAERTMRLEEKHLRADSQPHSRQPSPPELQGLFPSLSVLGHEPPPAVTSSCSSSVAGSAEMGSMSDMAGHMPIDPPLFLDPIEVSTAPTFSVPPSTASSLDDSALPPASTAYTGPSASQSRHTSRSRGSPSVASGGSTPPHSTGMRRTTVPAAGYGGLLSQFQQYQQQHHHRRHHHHHQQQQYLGGGLPMSVGQLSPKTGKRSGDAPYDVPERYRVHQSIIGPDKEDGTSWVMLFRKLGGLHAEWDVLIERQRRRSRASPQGWGPRPVSGQGHRLPARQASARRLLAALRLPLVVQVGGEWDVQVLPDPQRELYHAWGLGLSSTWYAMNPMALWRTWKLGTEEGIWNRNAQGGSKWQIGGAFGVDREGIVRWSKPAASADEIPDFKEALKVLTGN